MKSEQLKLKSNGKKSSEADQIHSLEKALESAKKAKQVLFEKLADRSIDRETFKEKKQEYDSEIETLEQKLSDASMAEQLARESDDEAAERIETAKNFLDLKNMTEEA